MADAQAIARELTEAAIAHWKALDPYETGVVFGDADDFFCGDPRFSASQYVPDDGKPVRITLGMLLGDRKWAMGQFTPEQAVGIVGLLLSKPAVAEAAASILTSQDTDNG